MPRLGLGLGLNLPRPIFTVEIQNFWNDSLFWNDSENWQD